MTTTTHTDDDSPPATRSGFRLLAWLARALTSTLWLCVGVTAAWSVFAWFWPQDLDQRSKPLVLLNAIGFAWQVTRFHLAIACAVAAILALTLLRWRLSLAGLLLGLTLAWPTLYSYAPKSPPPAAGETLRVHSINLLATNYRPAKIFAELAAVDAEVIAFQEWHEWHERFVTAGLADTYPYSVRVPSHHTAGLAIFSKRPILSSTPSGAYEINTAYGCRSQRAVIEHEGRTVAVWNVHPASPGDPRSFAAGQRQTADLVAALEKETLPMIVAGDFNAPTGSGNLIAVESVGLSEAHALAGVGPGWTWPRKRDGRVLKYLARLPGIRIDHVYLSDELTTTKAWVGDDHGSDHLGVAAEVAWRAGGLTAKHAARAFNSAPQRRMLAHMANRLARETSPYLLQHKDNPVDWFPWGEAAFAQARRRNVPVFLSVGYSTCYWCHVMEREVFENEEIAATMNERFVNVKVDREERPDVDEHYMTATQVLNDGQGGWPMSVFLKPDGEPFFAGTYFPPVDMPGRPGFPRVLESLSEAWQNNRADIDATAEQLRGILGRLALPPAPDGDVTFDDELLVKLVNQSVSDRDPRNGGFGTAPKFPRETLIETLLCAQHFYALDNAGWAPAIRGALDAMADGGIRDHLGGGFHRYSTDAKWLVPHFEMMLYDQAMLAWCYVEAYKQFEHGRYGRIARGILDFVLREMTDDGGAFYTAFDAEVDGSEGQNYLWTPQETIDVLGEADGRTFNAIYGLDQGFNFADPHGPNPHAPDRNVLFLAQPRHEGERHVGEMRRRLLEARDKRKGPTLDTKILTSWNGLMIRALAHAAKVLQDARYQAAAEKAANWLLRHHRNANGGLLRSSRDGRTQPVDGILDDYANLARGLVALWSAGGNEVYLDHAGELAAYMRTRFEDEDAGGYFYADAAADEIGAMSGLRRKIGADNPLPSGNASAALLMLELGKPRQCRAVLEAFAGQLADHPGSMCAMLEAAIRYKGRSGPFKVAGRAGRESRQSPPRSVESESAEAVEVSRAVWATPRRLDVTLHVARGFHLYAESTDGTRAVEVGSPATSYQRTEKPPPRDGGRYVGDVTFKLHFGRPASDSATEVVISYQACDATRCLLPMRKVVEVRPRA